MSEEFTNISKWLADNKLTVNLAKIETIVFHRPNSRNYFPSAELDVIKRVYIAKFLWFLRNDMSVENK